MTLLLASDVVLVMRFPSCEQGAASQHMGLRKRCCRRAREDVKRRDLPLGNGAVPVVKPPPAKWCCVAATTEHGASVDAPIGTKAFRRLMTIATESRRDVGRWERVLALPVREQRQPKTCG